MASVFIGLMILGVVVGFGNILIFIDIKAHFKFIDTICDGDFSVVQTKFLITQDFVKMVYGCSR
ncbi:MAG: hypothetical protein RL180_1470 [Pseudomonadota bacterium]